MTAKLKRPTTIVGRMLRGRQAHGRILHDLSLATHRLHKLDTNEFLPKIITFFCKVMIYRQHFSPPNCA